MKSIKLLILFIGMQISVVYSAQESFDFATDSAQGYVVHSKASTDKTVDTEQTRQEIIDQALIDYPHLSEEMDAVRQEYPVMVTWLDFLQTNLTSDDDEKDPNFGELHWFAADTTLERMKTIFLKTLEASIYQKKPLSQYDNAIFCYVMKHKDGYMKDIVTEWLMKWSLNQDSPLHTAAHNNSSDVIQLLLAVEGIDVNAKNSRGYTPLAIGVDSNFIECIIPLVQAGANIYERTLGSHETLLYYAVINRSIAMVRLLLQLGLDINVKNNADRTALHYAVWYEDLKFVKDLIKEGANVNALNNEGMTPLHYAAVNNKTKIIYVLLECGADATIRDSYDGKNVLESVGSNCKDRRMLKGIMKKQLNIFFIKNYSSMKSHGIL